MSVVVTAKVPKELKERARRYGIPISKFVRNALEAEVTRLEEEKLKSELENIARKLRGKITSETVADTVRETRDER